MLEKLDFAKDMKPLSHNPDSMKGNKKADPNVNGTKKRRQLRFLSGEHIQIHLRNYGRRSGRSRGITQMRVTSRWELLDREYKYVIATGLEKTELLPDIELRHCCM